MIQAPRILRALFAITLLAIGCGTPPPPQKPTAETQPDTAELLKRHVRVHLRSLGDWKELPITAPGGVLVDNRKMKRFVLRRNQEGNLIIRGEQGIITVGKKTYAGDLLWRHGKLIQNVALENYVLGVLRGEIPLRDIPLGAAAAQAITARSYTLHYVSKHDPVFDLDDTILFQVYAGLRYAPDDDTLREGVRSTAGMFLEYDGKPLKTYYHSTCGGHTTDLPTGLDKKPLAPMSGVPCDECRISKYWRWKSDAVQPFTIVERGPGGRARTIRSKGRTMHANEFRLAIGPSKLRSMRILSMDGTSIQGGGWGHGVGMCQMGAIARGRKNWSGERIVKYYYPGATLRRP